MTNQYFYMNNQKTTNDKLIIFIEAT